MLHRILLALALAVVPLGLAAHSVSEPTVAARMMLMTEIARDTKTLGQMAKGEVAFDAGRANAALRALRGAAGHIPARFEAQADHPESEALPDIWTRWDDFVGIAEAMAAAANAQVSDPSDLQPALAALGRTCRDCHRAYRE